MTQPHLCSRGEQQSAAGGPPGALGPGQGRWLGQKDEHGGRAWGVLPGGGLPSSCQEHLAVATTPAVG